MNTLDAPGRGLKFILPACFFIIAVASCGKDPISTVDCAGVTPTYNLDIKFILNASCATSGCHDAASQQNNINLSAYGPASSESHNDRFLGSIQHKRGYKQMPQDAAKLSQEKIDLLTCWVQNGSPE
ncbi:MAG: hypothetical protein IPL92_04985 [Saprospiraceae bacterium]|nr:hypothetical protein [Candidatus Opimibacter iunctus]